MPKLLTCLILFAPAGSRSVARFGDKTLHSADLQCGENALRRQCQVPSGLPGAPTRSRPTIDRPTKLHGPYDVYTAKPQS